MGAQQRCLVPWFPGQRGRRLKHGAQTCQEQRKGHSTFLLLCFKIFQSFTLSKAPWKRQKLPCVHSPFEFRADQWLFILSEASDGFSPNSSRQRSHRWTWHNMCCTELRRGTRLEQVRNRLPWSHREYNYLMTAICQFYRLQCQRNIACDSGNKAGLKWLFSTENQS